MKFAIGDSHEGTSKKSVGALLVHSTKSSGPQTATNHQSIHLIINTKNILTNKPDHIPRIIPITKKLNKPLNLTILLITKDPSTPYRTAITEKGSATEDVFKDIITLTKLKSISRSAKSLKKLFHEYDVLIADHRIAKFLPGLLGVQFYGKHRKVPFLVQMAKPAIDAQLKVGKAGKLKDDRCEPVYVKRQVKSIVGDTNCILSKGNCLDVVVGYTDFTTDEIMQNIDDVMKYLLSKKYLPVGGFIGSMKNIRGVHIKTNESAALPLMNVEIKND